MQQLLVYELARDNSLTRRSSKLRDLNIESLFEKYDEHFKDSTIDIKVYTALLIGGIYYIILRKDRSPFCGLDFNSEETLEKLKHTLTDICDKIFEIRDIDNKILQIARNLLKKGVDKSIIAESTGLNILQVELLEHPQ